MANLLLNEYPLLVMPSLAVKIGLNESIVLQQLHYWLQKSPHQREGRRWVYNSYKDWQEQLPFWSDTTIKRAILKLEKMGLVISGNFNKLPIDKTKWYSIDYVELNRVTHPSGQIDPSSGSMWPIEQVNLTRPLPETTTETTSEITKTISCLNLFGEEAIDDMKSDEDAFELFWAAYPRKTGKKAALGKWNARLKAGNTIDELIHSAEHYATYCELMKVEQKYQMHAATFLGPNERFLDFVDGVPEEAYQRGGYRGAQGIQYRREVSVTRQGQKSITNGPGRF